MAYADRVWLSEYRDSTPPDIPLGGEGGFSSAAEMFAATAAAHADKPLIYYAGTTLTVGEIDRMSSALAAGLVADGFAKGDRLAVYLQNVPQFAIAVLAAWKAGGIVVPINPMNKERELTYAIEDSGAKVLITLESLYTDVVSKSELPGLRVITTSELDLTTDDPLPSVFAASMRNRSAETLDLLEIVGEHDGEAPPAVELGPDDVAFLTYTSGTTGPPKGAMNTHGNVVFNSEAYRRWMDLTPDDCVLGIAPLFHITGIVAHLTVGLLVPMPIVLGFRFDPANILDLIERWRPTFTVGAITAFIALMNDPSWDGRDLSSLTKVYSGGAPIAPRHRRALPARGRRLHPQHLRPDRDDVAVARRADGRPGAGRPQLGRAVGGRADLQHRGAGRRRGGQRGAARATRRVRHQRPAGRRRLLEQAGGDRARAARPPPAHRRHRLHG